ncbi:response regulator [Candidatus Nitrosocosmicus arcticus]|uniref:Putative signal transduction response regulator receiver domain protein n=1 Tax=Candidatus Nitrosocosmicus arcticus TaxID=2035267 RepID=A0A557ST42_9ARCH|nr:response regulator [Candidatus Nitrosocosmicus arcticus]TVP39764.1 putative signal transduction response regulator receiver domain protein [Candidatus Nitrosocosmicus arcticus]
MNVLIIEDDDDICQLYSIWLEENRHDYIIAKNYEDGISEYEKSIQQSDENYKSDNNIFDLVVLDYDLPSKDMSSNQNGLHIAKEILELKSDQRIMFASAWPKKAFVEYVSTLKSVPEVLPKPFEKEEFINLAEKINLYDIAKKFTKQLREMKNPNSPDVDIKSLESLFKLMNNARREFLQKGNDKNSDIDFNE